MEIDAPLEDLRVSSDRRALSQILINLTGNGIKFTDAGGVWLRVRPMPSRRSVCFTVVDTGRGIRPEDQSKLFHAFSQIADKETRPQEGTGLGLHLSQRLARLLGGEITFESELGRGSAFTLRLPEA